MRIGTKKLSIWIEWEPLKVNWHNGIATIAINKGHYSTYFDEWVTNWWTFIPFLGWRIKR